LKAIPAERRSRRTRVEGLRRIIEDADPEQQTVERLVIDAMRQAILTNVFEPGDRLRQEELAELFGTSRIPVREALKALEYEGLVRSEPHRGFTVTSLDADDVDEVYELRILLEGEAIRLAIPLLTYEDLDALEELFQQLGNSVDPDAEFDARERFYLRLFAVSGRKRLVAWIVRLRQEVARPLRWPTIKYSPSHHAEFFDAVKSGNADEAVEKLAKHYRQVSALIRRYLREGGPAQGTVTPISRTHSARS
jgi:DNA-binding GntR family transcriptional regulator